MGRTLQGTRVIIVGAGLAGLTAAVQLKRDGADILLVEAQDRVGGRVLTIRGAFAEAQHAEGGGDFIDEGQHEIQRLAAEQGLTLRPVLRQGFSFVRHQGARGRLRSALKGEKVWRRLADMLRPMMEAYRGAHKRWDSPVARELARQSVAQWLDHVRADAELRAVARSLRGFFLADPEELSLLALVDQLASDVPGQEEMYRIDGGNDRLPLALAGRLGADLLLRTAARAARQDRTTVRVLLETATGASSSVKGDYLVLAAPATAVRKIDLQPPLPSLQAQAMNRLKYGRVTKALLQFDRPFWRKQSRPRAFGTDGPTGAVWDANEEQTGEAGILTLMAGGQASEDSRKLVAQQGVEGLVESLDWLGVGAARRIHSRLVTWEDDPWALGGYAYFDPAYDPGWREWLARPHGRMLFAGEHTSINWQGYMNGAVESGLRAAAEVSALAARGRSRSRVS